MIRILQKTSMLLIIAFCSLNVYGSFPVSQVDSCCSEINLKKIHDYINDEIETSGEKFLAFNGYEIHVESETIIRIKKDGWTYTIIDIEGEITSLAKSKRENQKQVAAAKRLLCELLFLINK